jgi:nucleoside-diphosphate-sugar epimerase
MRCLVTGASGHLGAALTRRLVEQEGQVAVLVRPQSDLWRLDDVLDRLAVFRADLADLSDVAATIRGFAPEVTFHLAWSGVTGHYRNDAEQITRNVSGSLALFELVRSAGCGGWVGVGSQAEYGYFNGLLTEEVPPEPVTAYGVAKLCVGLLTHKLCALAGMRYVWLRLLAIYGPRDDERHLIPTVIRQLLARQVPALTPGEQVWDYLYIDDAAEAIVAVAATRAAEGVYNLGSGDARTVRYLVERLRDAIDPTLPLGFGEVPYRPDQVMHLQADISRLRAVTGWAPRIGLDEGLRRTVEWHRAAQ